MCGLVLSVSVTSTWSCNGVVVVLVWLLSKVSVKVYCPAQNPSVSQLNVYWPVMGGGNMLAAPLCAVSCPLFNNVVEPTAQLFARRPGPFATSVTAAGLFTGKFVALKSSRTVNVMETMLPCTALAGTVGAAITDVGAPKLV
jgi:hypothetical protein